MINKLTTTLIFLFFPLFIFSQYSNYERGYSKGWQEGYCYENKEIACIPPTSPQPPLPTIEESSNSFKDGYLKGFQHGLAEPNSTPGYASTNDRNRYKYPEEVYKPDINQLALQVLSNRSRTSGRSSYAQRKDWVYGQAYPRLKRFDRVEKKLFKKGQKEDRRNRKKLKNKEIESLSSLTNGWYKSYIKIRTSFGKKKENFWFEKFVQVHNGKLINYIGRGDVIFPIVAFNKTYDGFQITPRFPDGNEEQKWVIKIIDSQPTTDLIEFDEPQHVMFYVTSDNGGGEVQVFIKGDVNRSSNIDKILYGRPSCDRSTGVAKMFLKPGKYEYFAYNKQSFWEGEIEVGNRCLSMQLTTN